MYFSSPLQPLTQWQRHYTLLVRSDKFIEDRIGGAYIPVSGLASLSELVLMPRWPALASSLHCPQAQATAYEWHCPNAFEVRRVSRNRERHWQLEALAASAAAVLTSV